MIFRLIRNAVQDRSSRKLNIRGDDSWQRGDLANAEHYFRAAIAFGTRSSALAMSNLGSLLLSKHCYDEGFDMLVRAAEANQEHPGILVNLGNAYFRSGQLTKCIEIYTRALQI